MVPRFGVGFWVALGLVAFKFVDPMPGAQVGWFQSAKRGIVNSRGSLPVLRAWKGAFKGAGAWGITTSTTSDSVMSNPSPGKLYSNSWPSFHPPPPKYSSVARDLTRRAQSERRGPMARKIHSAKVGGFGDGHPACLTRLVPSKKLPRQELT